MKCPKCGCENLDDRTTCYHCEQDLEMLRTVVNRVKHHFNAALEHAERDRSDEAIAELKHALELDASFVDGWVVLGTVYARKEMFEEAKEAWNRALALDHRFEKSHQYLIKAESASRALPTVKRIRAYAVVVTIAALALGAGFVYRLRPDGASDKIQQALDLEEEGRLADAGELLESASGDLIAPSRSRRLATYIKTKMDENLAREVVATSALGEGADFASALASVARLEALNPPPETATELTAIRTRVLDRIVVAAGRRLEEFRNGAIDYESLEETLLESKTLIGQSAAGSKIEKMLSEARDLSTQAVLAQARASIFEAESHVDANRRTEELARRHPSLAGELDAVLAARLESDARKLQNQMQVRIAEGALLRASETLQQTVALYKELGREAPPDLIGEMRSALGRAQSRVVYAEIEEAYEVNDYDKVKTLTDTLNRSDWSETQFAVLSAWRDDALADFSRSFWSWCNELDQRFEDLRINEDEARYMIENYEIALEHLPNATGYQRALILFRASAGYFKRGDIQKAGALIDRLEDEHGRSQILRYRAVKAFIGKVRGRLGETEAERK